MVPFYRLARGKEKKVVFDELSSPGLRMPFANVRQETLDLILTYLSWDLLLRRVLRIDKRALNES
jgi:hypothetical protein